MTWTQTILNLKDAAGTSQPVIAYTDGTNFSFAHPLLDNTGAIIAPATSTLQTTANTSLASIATAAALSSTSALQTSANTLLSDIQAALAGTLEVAGTVGITGTVPLPTGASTSALQSSGNTSLATIATNTTGGATATNQATANTALSAIESSVANIPSSPSTSALQTTGNTALAAIETAVQGATPAGTNLIGYTNAKDPVAVTGSITAADSGTTTVTNSVSQSITTGTPTANSFLTATLSAQTGITIQLSNTFNGTLVFERSIDGGVTYIPFSLEQVSIGLSVTTLTISDNKAYVLRGNCGEMTSVRVRCTAFTSGSLTALIQPGFGVGMIVANQGAPNTTYPWGVSAADGGITTIGSKADTTVTTPASSGSLIAFIKGILTGINSLVTGTVLAAGPNLIGSVNNSANTSGGTSVYAALGGTGNALLTNSPTAVKSSAGNLYGVNFYNPNSTPAYVQFFDVTSGTVTLGTTVPKASFIVPANGTWEEKFPDECKISFATAITAAATITATGGAAPTTGITANIIYK